MTDAPDNSEGVKRYTRISLDDAGQLAEFKMVDAEAYDALLAKLAELRKERNEYKAVAYNDTQRKLIDALQAQLTELRDAHRKAEEAAEGWRRQFGDALDKLSASEADRNFWHGQSIADTERLAESAFCRPILLPICVSMY